MNKVERMREEGRERESEGKREGGKERVRERESEGGREREGERERGRWDALRRVVLCGYR